MELRHYCTEVICKMCFKGSHLTLVRICFRTFLGAWPTFVTSLIGIGILTALIEQVNHFLESNYDILLIYVNVD